MKTTTKILLGITGGILLAILGFLLYIRLFSEPFTAFGMDEKTIERSFPACSFLEIEEIELLPFSMALLIASPSDSTQVGKLEIPAEMDAYILTEKEGNRLKIRFSDLAGLMRNKKVTPIDQVFLSYYPATLNGIKNRSNMNIQFTGFRSTVPVHIETKSVIECVDSSYFPVLTVDKAYRLGLKSSKIDTLTLNLDHVHFHDAKHCQIKVENLKAAGHRTVYIPRSEAAEVNWIPQDERASLSVGLNNIPAQIKYMDHDTMK